MIPEIIRMYLGRLSKDKRRQKKTRERREDNYHYSAGVQQKYFMNYKYKDFFKIKKIEYMKFHRGFRRKSFFYLARNFYIYAQFFYFFIFKKLNKNILGFSRNSI